MKELAASLKARLENSYSKDDIKKLEANSLGLRVQVKTLYVALEKFSIVSNSLKMLKGSERANCSKERLGIEGLATIRIGRIELGIVAQSHIQILKN